MISKKESMTCTICEDTPRCVVTYPCTHCVMCEKCAGAQNECPFCHQAITQRSTIFIPVWLMNDEMGETATLTHSILKLVCTCVCIWWNCWFLVGKVFRHSKTTASMMEYYLIPNLLPNGDMITQSKWFFKKISLVCVLYIYSCGMPCYWLVGWLV